MRECFGSAQTGRTHQLPQAIDRVLLVGENGRRDPELKLVACLEGRDAYKGEQGPEVIEGVLDWGTSQAPSIVGRKFACCPENLGGAVADFMGCKVIQVSLSVNKRVK